MILRHSMLNLFRSRKKSILFFFLIVMVVIILCIGTSLTVTINDFLDECNKSYTTTVGFILTVLLTACWLIGAIISIMQINRYSVQSILKAEE